MRRLLAIVLAAVLSATLLGAGGCVKITRGPGGTEVRPGSLEVTRHPAPNNPAPQGYFFSDENP